MKRFKVLFIYPNTMMATLIPLGLTQLAGALKENGIDVQLFDTTFYKTEEQSFEEKRVELLQIKPFDMSKSGVRYKETDIYEDLKNLIIDYEPDLIGITLVEDTVDLGHKLLNSIKDFDIPVVAGGVHVTLNPEEVVNCNEIDYLCIGEGEGALLDLCHNLAEKKDIRGIKNLWVKCEDEICKNDLRPLVDLDSSPYLDFSIWQEKRLMRPMYGKSYMMLHVEVERGCPFQCAYCAAPALRERYRNNGYNHYYRRKRYQRVIEEIKHYMSLYEVDYIYFNAESFLSFPLDAFEEFAKRYKKEIYLPFWCQTRVENITDKKVKLLSEMGCACMQFGIESGNESLRNKLLQRKHTNKMIVDALKIVEKYAIPFTVNNIIGFPKETRDMVFDTIDINRQINPRTINCFMFTPYRGTSLHSYCIENGLLLKEARTSQSLDGSPMQNLPLTKEELKGLQRTFPLYCRFPKERFKEIESAEEFTVEGDTNFKRLSEEYRNLYFN